MAELKPKKSLDASTSNMNKCLRIQAEKERNKLKEEKRKLKYIIGFRQKETTRAKLKKIKEMSEN
jgi:radical SAM superfamily enzyme